MFQGSMQYSMLTLCEQIKTNYEKKVCLNQIIQEEIDVPLNLHFCDK